MSWDVIIPLHRVDWRGVDKCVHVAADQTKAFRCTQTHHALSDDKPIVICEFCHDAFANSPYIEPCIDCGETVPNKRVVLWKPHDFYSPNGDTPTPVCHKCLGGAAHLERIAEDRRARGIKY